MHSGRFGSLSVVYLPCLVGCEPSAGKIACAKVSSPSCRNTRKLQLHSRSVTWVLRDLS